MKLIDWYADANRRFVASYMTTYVPWSRRHVPYSLAVGPLILGGAVLVSWFGFGLGLRKAVLYFLVPAVVLLVVSAAIGLWMGGRRRRRSN